MIKSYMKFWDAEEEEISEEASSKESIGQAYAGEDDEKANMITLLHFENSIFRERKPTKLGTGGAQLDVMEIGEFTIKKYLDKTSPLLTKATLEEFRDKEAADGFPKAEVLIFESNSADPDPIQKYVFHEVKVIEHRTILPDLTNPGESNPPQEIVKMTYVGMQVSHVPSDVTEVMGYLQKFEEE